MSQITVGNRGSVFVTMPPTDSGVTVVAVVSGDGTVDGDWLDSDSGTLVGPETNEFSVTEYSFTAEYDSVVTVSYIQVFFESNVAKVPSVNPRSSVEVEA